MRHDTQPADTSPAFERHLLHYGRDFVRELIVRAKGSYLYAENGRAILDFSSGQMCSTIGHNHPAIVEAMANAGATVLHLDSTMLSPDVVALAEILAGLLPDTGGAPATVVTASMIGVPGEALSRYASRVAADLIVVGVQPHGAIEKMLVGSTTETVLRHAPCPVMTVPNHRGAGLGG